LVLLSDVLPSDLVGLLERYARSLKDAAEEFARAVELINDVRIGEARSAFANTVKLLDETSPLKTEIEERVVELSLDPGFKEELLSLVGMLDGVGDSIKEAAREFTIVPFLELPQKLREGVIRLSRSASRAIALLAESLGLVISGKYKELEDLFKKLIAVEEEADALNLENRAVMLELSEKIKPYALQLMTYHLVVHLEEITDLCTQVAQRARLVVHAWLA